LGRVADLVNKLPHGSLTTEEHHELAVLLDSLSGIQNTLVHWGFPGGIVKEGPGIDITGSTRIGVGHDSILLVDSGSISAREYAANNTGFAAALSAATSGDAILVPTCTVTGNHTITAGVKVVGYSRYATIFSGQITMGGDGSSMENLTIKRIADDSSDYKALINPDSGTAYAHSCDLIISQTGSGDAKVVNLDNNGILEMWNCLCSGASTSGSGYAGFDGGGTGGLYFFGGRCYGSTDEFG